MVLNQIKKWQKSTIDEQTVISRKRYFVNNPSAAVLVLLEEYEKEKYLLLDVIAVLILLFEKWLGHGERREEAIRT